MSQRIALITNTRQFGGPGSAQALASNEFVVICHDKSFEDQTIREQFEKDHYLLKTTGEQNPRALIQEVTNKYGRVDVVVSNDVYPASFSPIDEASVDEYRDSLEALMVAPFALIKEVTPQMKQRREGHIIMITSALPIGPYQELSMYVSSRGGANSLVKALARELGPYNIQINAIGPNFLESPSYYPRDKWENNPTCRSYMDAHVPLQRLGNPEELGELVAFLASGKCNFVTGEVIYFTGGWPGMPPWPGRES